MTTPTANSETVTSSGIAHRFSAYLRRQTSGRTYVPEVDGLRFIAILSVVVFHIAVQVPEQPNGYRIANILSPFVHNGYRGVQLFFVISGFILGLPFARHRLTGDSAMRLRAYFLRRVTRLEPPYFAIMLIRAALAIAILHKTAGIIVPHLLASLLYAHNLIYGRDSVINPPAWSLEVEIQFYLLAPLIAWLLFSIRRAGWRRCLMLILIVAIGVLQQLFIAPDSRPALSIVYWIQDFLAGFVLCDLFIVDWKSIPSHWIWDIACLPLWLWVFWWNSEWYRVLLPLACIVLYIGAFKGPLQRAFFRNPIIALTGGMCYSIYLTHNLTLTVALRLFRRLSSQPSPNIPGVCVISAFVVLLAFGVGLLFYVALERPCMERDWPQKLAARIRARLPQPAPSLDKSL
ncbi:MAG TPA: acyltransferase [Acidobacteriaceae bacterium]|nr:acyltransferase [Acidobacteriaceae bacterium]